MQPRHGWLQRERQQLRQDQVADQRAGLPQDHSPATVGRTAAISCQIPRQTARATQDGSAAEARSGSAAGGPASAAGGPVPAGWTASPVSPSTLDPLDPAVTVTRAERYRAAVSLPMLALLSPSGRSAQPSSRTDMTVTWLPAISVDAILWGFVP